jgi:hypothetical protein
VLTSASARPLRRTRFPEVWRPAAAAAELGDGVTFRDLRHYYASLLIQAGESVKTVQRRLGSQVRGGDAGHLQPPVWPDSEDRTREAVDAVLGRGVARKQGAGR